MIQKIFKLYPIVYLIISFNSQNLLAKSICVKNNTLMNKKMNIDIEYPQISIPSKLNIAITKLINQEKSFYLKCLNYDYPQKNTSEVYQNSSLNISYNIDYQTSNFISVAVYSTNSIYGSAHGSDNVTTFNYTLADDKLLSFQNCFIPKSNYLTIIKNLTATDLAKQLAKEKTLNINTIKTLIEAKNKTFKNFSLTKTQLIIYFNEYEVFPYFMGIQKANIAIKTLKKYLRPEILNILK